jgi:hypothetical protein
MFAYNKPRSNSTKKATKFMRGLRENRGKCWFDAKQKVASRLQYAIYMNIEIRCSIPWLKNIKDLKI